MSETLDLFSGGSGGYGGEIDAGVEGGQACSPPSIPPMSPVDAPLGDDETALDLFAEQAYLAYAMSVVKGRALPQIEDGQKPVQRRILYSMHEMGLKAGAKHVKSARVVGDVLGKLHPHGDSSVYDAMVRIAQDFSLRYPLADGQGNFGSREDGAAAMRYTEIRLTPIAELLLSEIHRGTVDFKPNYDGSLEEPVLLPARLPFVLLNGASGIAVGMATEIPPHNLNEVASAAIALIQNPDATVSELMEHIHGPDFPGGGQIISPVGAIRESYESGRGSVRIRARWRIEEMARGQWRVIVYELPQGVSVAQVMAEIEVLTNPQPRAGKKDITQEQKNLKAAVLAVVDSDRDESSDVEKVRLVLEPKSSKIDPAAFMAVLLANTSLETSITINLTMIGLDGNPQQKNLRQIVAEWVEFRYVTVERRTRFRLDEVVSRVHILDGRMIAFLRIEEVIRVIREADEPKEALMSSFGLSQVQAEDILEIRLRQLARLEGIKIEKELAELRTERAELEALLASQAAMTAAIIKEIEADAKKFGDNRRSLIQSDTPATSRGADVTTSVPDEPVTVILSKAGWIRSRQGHGIDAATISYKTGDAGFVVLETRTTWPLLIVDSNGRAYSVPVSAIPGGKGDGVPLATQIDLQAGGKVAQVLSAAPTAKFLFANSAGYGFVATVSDLEGRNKAGKAFMTLEPGETVLPPAAVGGSHIFGTSSNARLIVFSADEMKELPKGRGVIVMGLDDGCTLTQVAYCDGATVEFVWKGVGRPIMVRIAGEDIGRYLLHRARKGCQLPKLSVKPA